MDSTKDKAKKNRSAAYPSTGLAEAVEQLKMIHNDLGKGPFDRDSAAKSIGYNGVSGASASKIAALVHYGLIQRVGSGYIETDLGTSIVLSFDQEEESRALLEAFKSPTLFSKLLSDFGGKALPAKLEVILVRQYRITEQASKDAAKAFRESAEFVGVLKNGFLIEKAEIDVAGDHERAAEILHTDERTIEADYTRGTFKSLPDEIAIEVRKGIKVVFSNDLMLHMATGKFSKGIEQLAKDFDSLSLQTTSIDMADDHEEAQS